ncbi:hypothetical protein AX16_001346 [Volvariella volvacea WC 439]|nr:hypothetical protein AX16_001346 [Volvariella volvacea WC 439]
MSNPGDSATSARFSGSALQNDGTVIVGNQNTVYNYGSPYGGNNQARAMLREVIVPDAMYTGNVRAEPLECDPYTRQDIVEGIVTWMEDPDRRHNILWLHGPAGAGKSAIAKTTAVRLERNDSKAKVAGSFFFLRSDSLRNNLRRFILTLSYGLATCVEAAGAEIDKTINRDPTVFAANLQVQWRRLIVEPVLAVENMPPVVMIIDGLDECINWRDRRTVLQLIASCDPSFPVAFIISSRTERLFVNLFNAEPLASLSRPSIDLATCKNDPEMKAFITNKFAKIYDEYRDILHPYSNGGIWPSEDVVDQITFKADGQYIYPVTLFKYIDEVDANPHERLQACLEEIPEALSPLDTLYNQIFQSSHGPQDTEIQDCLFLLLPCSDREPLGVLMMAAILGIDTIKYRFNLRKLHSVIDIPEDDYNIVRIHHQSIIDFLLNRDRNPTYFIDERACAIRVMKRCLSALERYPTSTTQLNALLLCWWSCAGLLSHEDVAPELAPRMENLDFMGILREFPGVLGYEFLCHCYAEFIAKCQAWVHSGSKDTVGPQEINYWKNSTLLENFKPHALYIASHAQSLMKHFKAFYKEPDSNTSGACPLSWTGLLVVAQAEVEEIGTVRLWNLVKDDKSDNFVHMALLVLASGALSQMLYATRSSTSYLD